MAPRQAVLGMENAGFYYGATRVFEGVSFLLDDARTIYRSATERARPEGSRLREYGPSRIGGVHAGILAEAAVHPVLEKLAIAFWLDKAREYLGADHPAIKAMFGARASREIAADIVDNSQVGDAAFRTEQGMVQAVDHVSFDVGEGELLGALGEFPRIVAGAAERGDPAMREPLARLAALTEPIDIDTPCSATG